VRVAPARLRSLEALARENAREGCVGETYGAVVACWQAAHAADPEVRAAAAALCEDELGHAELAWEIDAWIQPRLSPQARARLAAEQREAIQALEAAPAPERSLQSLAGLPGGAEQAQLLAQLWQQLWGAA
jgi:hypothetical protein